jgi:glycosyltransferase 2 family protein
MSEKVISKKNQLRSILLITGLMTVTVAVILKDYTINELVEAVRKVHPFYLLAGIGLMFLFIGCQAMNFSMIMSSLGQPSSFRYCIEYAYIGNYFGAITPGASGGQPAQIYYMNKDKIHIDISSITIFLMVFVSQIVIVLMGGVFVLLRFGMLERSADWFSYLLIAGSAVMLGLTGILFALMFSRRTVPFLVDLTFRFGKKIHVIKKPEEIQIKFDILIIAYREKARMILKHPSLYVKVFLVTVLQWVAYGMVSYLVYLSFGYRKADILDLMGGQAFINIAVAAVPLPGSVGIAEKSFLILFGQYYPANDLTSAMIIGRIINFYLPLLISFLVYIFAHHRMMKAKMGKD